MLNAIIIGCGRIGGGHEIYSHAAAYSSHQEFNISACIESNPETRKEFQATWNVEHGFQDLDQFLSSGINFDVASVCVPTMHHEAILDALLKTNVKAVFCEKPLTGNLDTAQKLVEKYGNANIHLAVNYHRRWDTELQKLKSDLDAGVWGDIQSIHGIYMRGLWNNGSHILNLIEYLTGPLQCLALHKKIPGIPQDQTVDATLCTSDNKIVHLIGLNSDPYFMHEIAITTTKAMIIIENAGCNIRIRSAQDDPVFPEERNLSEGTISKTNNDKAFLTAVDNIYRTLTGNEPLENSGESALSTLALCTELSSMSPIL